jgi:hypothetical protein
MKVIAGFVAAFLTCSQCPLSAAALQASQPSVEDAALTELPPQDKSSAPTERALRAIIAELQEGNPKYSRVEPVLQPFIQPASIQLLQRFGPLQKVKYMENQNGSDTFKVDFLNGSTKWTIRLSNSGHIAELTLQLYRGGN